MATPQQPNHSLAPDPLIGRTLGGRYQIQELIAKGGMGRIYKAMQQPLDRRVALKVLSIDKQDNASEDFKQRFFREASICSKLTHPNTVRIYDYGQTEDDVYFIAMEYLEGMTLRQALAADAPMAPWRVIDLLLQVCASLTEAHSRGLIHRDLKPSNIILTRHADGREFVNVVDFGLVKDLLGGLDDGTDMTQAGIIIGSPMYMSPEQILQHTLTERSDIYSLGVIMYGMLTGRKPFRQESPLAIMNCHINVQPPEPSEAAPELELPASLEWVTMVCMAKQPEERFANVSELTRALKACDLELRGALPGLQLRLEAGRVVLPLEFEQRLARRSGAGSTSNSYTGPPPSQSRSNPTLRQGAAVQEPPEKRRTWLLLLLPVLLLFLLVSALVFGLLLRRTVDESAPPAPRTAAPALTAPAPTPAPAEGSAAPEPEGTPEEELIEEAAPPPEPPEAAPARTAPKRARPKRPRSQPTPKPQPSSAPPPSDPEPSPEPSPPEPEEDDWETPSSDIKDPWED